MRPSRMLKYDSSINLCFYFLYPLVVKSARSEVLPAPFPLQLILVLQQHIHNLVFSIVNTELYHEKHEKHT